MKKTLTYLLLYFFFLSACVLQEQEFSVPGPTALRPTNLNSVSFTANWTRVVGASYYDLEVIDLLEVKKIISTTDTGKKIETNFFKLTNLRVNTLYQYRVRAVFGDKTLSTWSDTV